MNDRTSAERNSIKKKKQQQQFGNRIISNRGIAHIFAILIELEIYERN